MEKDRVLEEIKINRNVKRVKFGVVPIGEICCTEWNQVVMRTEEVRIKTDGEINWRNAVNLDTGKLLPIDTSQWVWFDESKLKQMGE